MTWQRNIHEKHPSIQDCSCIPEIIQEVTLLKRIIYKNSNQHKNSKPFKELQHLWRLLKLLFPPHLLSTSSPPSPMPLISDLRYLYDAMHVASKPTLSSQQRNVPHASMAIKLLRYITSTCHIVQSIEEVTLCAGSLFSMQLAQSFFMPLSLTCIALIARLLVR